jgi:hypothetical protein
MITTSASRRSRVLEIAVALSLIVHVLALLIYIGLLQRFFLGERRLQQKPDEFVSVSDVIRIEKRTIPPPAIVRPVQPPQPPAVVERPVERPVPVRKPRAAPTPAQRRELAHLAPDAPPRPRAAPKTVIADPHPFAPSKTPAQPQSRQPAPLSPDAMAALDQRFSRAIAQANSDVRNIAPPNQVPSSTKRYNIRMLGFTDRELQNAQGVVDRFEPCSPPVRHCWFLRVQYVWNDGFIEMVSIPWPFFFSDSFDPAMYPTRQMFPTQPPPRGFKLPHPFALSRLVCHYFEAECKEVLDAEASNGGQPAQAVR